MNTSFRSLLSQFVGMARLLRRRPFDVSTSQGRSDERHRRAALTSLASALSKTISVVSTLISVPLTLHYLGPERYGMWMTMNSIVWMLNFTDFGIGNGVMNAVSAAYGRDEPSVIRKYVSSGYVILTIIAAAVLLLFAAIYTLVPWYRLFNVVSAAARSEAPSAVAAVAVCFALAIPLGIVHRVQMGLQRGFLSSLWQCLGSLLGLIGVVAAVLLHAGLPFLVFAFLGFPLLASFVNSIVFFGFQQQQMAPTPRAVSRAAIVQVGHVGILFFVLQITYAMMFYPDNFVIAQLIGAKAVTDYAVPQRMFSTVYVVLIIALSPLWPAYGEAMTRGDYDWVWKTLKRSFLIAVGVAALASIVLVCTGEWLLCKWLGHGFGTPFGLLLGLGVLQVVQSGGAAVAVCLNGLNVIRFQAITGTVAAVAALALKIWLVRIVGISGVVWATSFAYVACIGLPTYFYLLKRMRVA